MRDAWGWFACCLDAETKIKKRIPWRCGDNSGREYVAFVLLTKRRKLRRYYRCTCTVCTVVCAILVKDRHRRRHETISIASLTFFPQYERINCRLAWTTYIYIHTRLTQNNHVFFFVQIVQNFPWPTAAAVETLLSPKVFATFARVRAVWLMLYET